MAAAAWSWVEKMLQLAQRRSPPSSAKVSIRMAVWMVMCSEPDMRTPFKGCSLPYFSRNAISPGISFSETSISLRPQAASPISATLYFKSLLYIML